MKRFFIFLLTLMVFNVSQVVAGDDERLFDAVIVDMINNQGDKIGEAKITSFRQGGVYIQLRVSHLTPGPHAVHIHENGKCEPPDFTSAGAHFNPKKKQHGFHNPDGYHQGDLPNIFADEQGRALADFIVKDLTLEENMPNSIRHKSIIIHEKEDDYQTDPSGNSGARFACGVIN